MILIESKIKKLEELVTRRNISLNNRSVVIALPALNENMRSIYISNKELYESQRKDADVLARYLIDSMGTDLVSLGMGCDKVNNLAKSVLRPYDFVIFLHEVGKFESFSILLALKSHNQFLQHFDLS